MQIIFFLFVHENICCGASYEYHKIHFLGDIRIKALTALAGQLSLSVGWENSPERGHTIVSFNP